MEDCMLTTTDNPFDPFTQFEEWYVYDTQKGYNTCSYLARIAKTSEELSDSENDSILNQAMQEIVDMNLTGNYIIVTRENEKTIPILFRNTIKI